MISAWLEIWARKLLNAEWGIWDDTPSTEWSDNDTGTD
jgi:hypothetical protein